MGEAQGNAGNGVFRRGDRVKLKASVKAGPKPRIGEKNWPDAHVVSVDGRKVRLDRYMKGYKLVDVAEIEPVS